MSSSSSIDAGNVRYLLNSRRTDACNGCAEVLPPGQGRVVEDQEKQRAVSKAFPEDLQHFNQEKPLEVAKLLVVSRNELHMLLGSKYL
jgi:hypothetical protein